VNGSSKRVVLVISSGSTAKTQRREAFTSLQ
jgi:hypothetical protein